jgi:hypothetical protein
MLVRGSVTDGKKFTIMIPIRKNFSPEFRFRISSENSKGSATGQMLEVPRG